MESALEKSTCTLQKKPVYLQLYIYENFIYIQYSFLSLFEWGKKNRGRGGEGVSITRNWLIFKNSTTKITWTQKMILADAKLTNFEKQVRDGGRLSEERYIVSIDTDQT